jgi:hypothetical protein
VPRFLYGTVAEVAFDGGGGICGALFAIRGEQRFNLVPHPAGMMRRQVPLSSHCRPFVYSRPSLL